MNTELKYYEGKTFAEIEPAYKFELNNLSYDVWEIEIGGLLYRFAPIDLFDAIVIDNGDDDNKLSLRKKANLCDSVTAFVLPKGFVTEAVNGHMAEDNLIRVEDNLVEALKRAQVLTKELSNQPSLDIALSEMEFAIEEALECAREFALPEVRHEA